MSSRRIVEKNIEGKGEAVVRLESEDCGTEQRKVKALKRFRKSLCGEERNTWEEQR